MEGKGGDAPEEQVDYEISAVPARLGLKALALAWPEVALASSSTRPGQSHQTWLGLA